MTTTDETAASDSRHRIAIVGGSAGGLGRVVTRLGDTLGK